MNDGIKSVLIGEYVMSFEDDPDPGPVFLEKARLELRETPTIREEAVKELIERIKKTEDLELNLTEDAKVLILAFLRTCKFYVDSAYEKVLKTYRFREKYSKYFANLHPKEEKSAFENNLFTVMPYRDQHGRRTLLIEIGKKWNIKNVSLLEIVRGIVSIIEAAQLEPKTQIAGVNIIIDLEGLSVSHVWQFSPSFAKFLLDFIQEHLPLRVKSVHIVNQPYIFNMLYSIFKPFILEKLRERIFFHGNDMTTLTTHIEPKFLPTQYGGILEFETIYGLAIHEILSQYQHRFDDINTRGFLPKKKSDKKK